MAVTLEELTDAGAGPEFARLLLRELRRNDRLAGGSPRRALTLDPIGGGMVVVFRSARYWLAIGVIETPSGAKVLRVKTASFRMM